MPLDRTTRQHIHDVVQDWVRQGKMFTAFEVSLAVKERGVRERHRNLRETVHEVIFALGGPEGYTRTLMDVGAPEQAWVYHPPSSNPYRYRPLNRTGQDPVEADLPTILTNGVRQPSRLVWDSPRRAAVPDGAYGTDQRGRLCVPVHFVHQLGVGPGERVQVICEESQGRVRVVKPGPAEQLAPDAAYTAEPDGNVRLTQTTLDKAGIAGFQCYRIEGDEAGVVVRRFEE